MQEPGRAALDRTVPRPSSAYPVWTYPSVRELPGPAPGASKPSQVCIRWRPDGGVSRKTGRNSRRRPRERQVLDRQGLVGGAHRSRRGTARRISCRFRAAVTIPAQTGARRTGRGGGETAGRRRNRRPAGANRPARHPGPARPPANRTARAAGGRDSNGHGAPEPSGRTIGRAVAGSDQLILTFTAGRGLTTTTGLAGFTTTTGFAGLTTTTGAAQR